MQQPMDQIDAHSLLARLKQGNPLNLLDVREEMEYHTFNVGGINFPLSRFSQNIDQFPYNKTDEIIVICKVGLRSETAQNILIQNGYYNVKNLTGGLIALQKIQ